MDRKGFSIIGLIVCLVCLAFLNTACAAGTLVLHVAPDGKDSWTGRRRRPADGDGPLASIAGARDRIRELRKMPGGLKQPVRVEIADGVYRIRETISFTPSDSGTAECPITYCAAAGAKPVISGARVIKGWKSTPSGKLWQAEVPDARAGKWHFRQLFVGGTRYVRARRPNLEDYWFYFEKVQRLDKEGKATFKERQIKNWPDLDEMEIVLFRMWDISRLRIAKIDEKKRLLRFAFPKDERWLAHWDPRYYIENSLAFLDSPGEWHLDRRKGILFVQPLAGHRPDRELVVAPVVDKLILFEGTPENAVKHIRFEDLTFAHSAWTLAPEGFDGHQGGVAVGGSIEGDYTEECAFEKCTFKQLGRYAVNLRRGCKKNVIRSCEFTDLGGGGILIGDKKDPPEEADQTSGNQIIRCHVHHTGKVWHGSNGIWIGYANHTRIAHCYVHHVPCNGISVGWGWTRKPSSAHHNIVEHNRVHHAMMYMGDGGGIYTLNVQPGTVIRNNVVHDVRGYHANGNGIYMDSSSGKMLVENNVVCRVIRTSVVLGGAQTVGSVIRNNIFALGKCESISGYSKHGRNHVFERNIIYLGEGPLVENWLANTFRHIDHNVYFSTREAWPITFLNDMSFEAWQESGRDVHSVMADPMFVDAANGDFRLRPDSPALKLGFKQIKVKPIGPPPDKEWANPWKSKRLVEIFNLATMIHRTHRRPKPRLTAPFRTRKIKIDGRAESSEWGDVRAVPLTQSIAGESKIAGASRMQIAWDKRTLYLFVTSDLTGAGKIRASGATWRRDDGIQFSLEDPSTGVLTVFHVFRGFASGKFEAMRFRTSHRSREIFKADKKHFLYAAAVGKGSWSAEFAIPLADYGIKPSRHKALHFNIEVYHSAGNERLVWVSPGNSVWYLDRGGLIDIQRPPPSKAAPK